MAKRKPPPKIEEHWLCEFCQRPHFGVDPPDECEICGNKYFNNLKDVFDELDTFATRH